MAVGACSSSSAEKHGHGCRLFNPRAGYLPAVGERLIHQPLVLELVPAGRQAGSTGAVHAL